MHIDDRLHALTTPINVAFVGNRVSQGSGFFFYDLEPKNGEGPQWRGLRGQYLVTNRHVVFPPDFGGLEAVTHISELRFFFRGISENRQSIKRVTKVLDGVAVAERTLLHHDSEVDICLIDIGDIVVSEIRRQALPKTPEHVAKLGFLYHGITDSNFPESTPIQVTTGDDILIVGYPRGYYDTKNLFPIVKRGSIASKWGERFEGKPYFLIDSKLYAGSSGSLVITKPTNLTVENDRILLNKDMDFCFLGIYSAEPVKQPPALDLGVLKISGVLSWGLGIVWYYNLIPEIIANPQRLS